MKNLPVTSKKEIVPIGEASKLLGVSIDTLRRWDKKGKIKSIRVDGKNRFFKISDMETLKTKDKETLTISEAAKALKVSSSTLRRYEKKGILKPKRNSRGDRVYFKKNLASFKKPKREEKRQIEKPKEQVVPIFTPPPAQQPLPRFFEEKRHYPSTFIVVLLLITTIFSTLYIQEKYRSNYDEIQTTYTKVLGAKNEGGVVGFFEKISDIIKATNSRLVAQYKSLFIGGQIANVNEIFEYDNEGNLVPKVPINITKPGLLKIKETVTVIQNLNADTLQGKRPGSSEGDLAVFSVGGQITGLIVSSSLLAGSVSGGTGGIILDSSITSADLADDVISSLKILNGTIVNADIADGAINAAKIEDGTVDVGELAGTLTFSDGNFLDLAFVVHDDSVLQGLRLPNVASATPTSPVSGEGFLAYDTAGNQAIVYDGSSWTAIGGGVTLTTSSDTSTTSSNSGLELTSDELSLIRGCATDELLKWNDTNKTWACATDVGAAGASLQGAYDAGNTITTTDSRDIDIVLDDTTTDSNFDINTVADNFVSISRSDGVSTETPTQLLLIENLDIDLTIANGILVNVATGGVITDGLDVSDPQIVNAINIGANAIAGTNFSVTGAGAVTAASISLLNSETIVNSTDSELAFSDGTNTLTLDFDEDTGTAVDFTTNGSVDITFSPGGNVGIGTTTPSALLNVVGLSTGNIVTISNTSTTGGTGLQASATGDLGVGNNIGIYGNASSGTNHIIYYDFGVRGYSYSGRANSQVGVYGHSAVGGTGLQVGGYFALTTGSVQITGGNVKAALIADNNAQAAPIFLARDNGTEIFRIDDGGNVGIGDASPVAGLVVGDDTTAGIANGAGDIYVQNDLEVDGLIYGDGTNISNVVAADLSCTNCIGAIEISDLALGTDTTGNYIDNVTGGNGIAVTGSAGEGWEPAVAVDLLGAADGVGLTTNNSGFEFAGGSSDTLALLQGCSDNQILKWDEADSTWNCEADTGVGGGSLDDAYNSAAATIIVDGYDITFELNDATNDYSFVVDNTTTGDLATAFAITTTGAGGTFATGIDVSDGGITIGLSVGANTIAGTTGNIDYTNFDVEGSSGNIDTAGTIQVGSNNVTLTDSTGLIFHDSLVDCADTQILKWSTGGDRWGCAADSGGGGAWNDLTAPTGALSLSHGVNITAFDWTATGALDAWTFDFNNNAGTTTTQRAVTIANTVTAQTVDVNTEALLLLDNEDTTASGSTVIDNGILITVSGAIADGIIDAIDASDANITNAINIGANAILGTNFSVTGAGAVTAAGAIAANGGITFDASTDTLGAHTMAGTLDFGNNLAINLGNAGTDFDGSGGLTLAANLTITAGGATVTAGALAVNSGSITSDGALTIDAVDSVILGGGGNTFTFDESSGPLYAGTARPTKRVTISPEFEGASLTADGGSNTGTMTSDNMTSTPYRNYYNWTTTQGGSQDYDVWIRVPLPADFDAMASANAVIVETWSDSLANTTATIDVFDTGNTSDCTGVSIETTTVDTWEDATPTGCTGGTYTANGIMTIQIKLGSVSSSNIRLGRIYFDYEAKF